MVPSSGSDSGSGPALTGEVALVACTVDAWPAPHLAIYRDKVTWQLPACKLLEIMLRTPSILNLHVPQELRVSVSSSDRVLVSAGSQEEDPAVFR